MIYYTETLPGCIVAILGIISSIATLLLIKFLKNWNGYLFIITAMTFSQIVFESSFLFLSFSDATDHWSIQASEFLNSFGLISVILWTNVLSFIAFIVAKNHKTINVLKYQASITFAILIPSLAVAVFSTFRQISPVKQFNKGIIALGIEIFLIAVNIFFFIITYIFVRRVIDTAKSTPNYDNSHLLTRARAIRVLTYRMGLYPLYQVVSRLICFWYLARYCICNSIGQV